MARKRPDHKPVHRTDLLPSNLTASKAAKLGTLMDAWRETAVELGREQWKLFFTTGFFNKMHDVDKVTYALLLGSAARVQMCRYTVVGQLKSWISNRVNDFRSVVSSYEGAACAPGGALDPGVRHMLNTINVRKAWFNRNPIVMPQSATGVLGGTEEDLLEDVTDANGTVVGTRVVGTHTVGGTPLAGLTIPDTVRKLARTIMRAVMAKHRRPNLSGISMILDARGGEVRTPKGATQKGKVSYWIHLSTMDKGGTIDIPLLGHAFHAQRAGIRSKGIQVNRNRVGVFTFGVITDIGPACADSRAAYTAETQALKALAREQKKAQKAKAKKAKTAKKGAGVTQKGAKTAQSGAGTPTPPNTRTLLWSSVPDYDETIALDFGLTTLFGTSQGQLLGVGWLKRLKVIDTRIQNIARGVQKRGGKVRDNAR